MARDKRDSQQSKVYRSEQCVMHVGSRTMTLDQIDFFLASVTESRFFRELWLKHRGVQIAEGPANRDIGDGRARRVACGWFGGYTTSAPYAPKVPTVGMKLPVWARTNWVVLHELMHSVQGPKTAAHGWEFCEGFLALVNRFIGLEAGTALRAEFDRRRVRYRKPRKRAPVSEARRTQLRNQLAKARLAKEEKKILRAATGLDLI